MTFIVSEWLDWMAATTLVFWFLPARWRFLGLVAITAAYLILKDPASCTVLLVLTFLTHALTRGDALTGKQTALAILPVVAILAGFKIFKGSATGDMMTDTVIPLGLSYYSLRCIHYALERYKGQVAEKPLLPLFEYLFFLPTLFVGPIHRYPAFERDRKRHRWDVHNFSEGLERILYGYVKVVVLGNLFASQVIPLIANRYVADGSFLDLYLEMVQIGLNLYFQFSGFSDIAIGFGLLLGFRVMENFNWPFFARNISDFWSRWHISLTDWCREYVYTSVFALTRSPALGAVATLIAVGLWHEISLRYLAWGLYHGLGIVAWQRFRRFADALPPLENRGLRLAATTVSTVLTIHFVWLGFLLVRQPDFATAYQVLRDLFMLGG